MGLVLRSLTLSIIAIFGTWYAALDGRAALVRALPEVSAVAPATTAAVTIDSTQDLLLWLVALAVPIAAVLVLIARRRPGRTSARTAWTLFPAEEQLWAGHLVWLEHCRKTHRRARSLRERLMPASTPRPSAASQRA